MRLDDYVIAYPVDADGNRRSQSIRGYVCGFLPSGNVIIRTWDSTYFCKPDVTVLHYGERSSDDEPDWNEFENPPMFW